MRQNHDDCRSRDTSSKFHNFFFRAGLAQQVSREWNFFVGKIDELKNLKDKLKNCTASYSSCKNIKWQIPSTYKRVWKKQTNRGKNSIQFFKWTAFWNSIGTPDDDKSKKSVQYRVQYRRPRLLEITIPKDLTEFWQISYAYTGVYRFHIKRIPTNLHRKNNINRKTTTQLTQGTGKRVMQTSKG